MKPLVFISIIIALAFGPTTSSFYHPKAFFSKLELDLLNEALDTLVRKKGFVLKFLFQWNTSICHILCSIFSFFISCNFEFYLIKALVYVNKDQGIHKEKNGRTCRMLSLELAGWFYATVFMVTSICTSIRISK